MVMSRLSEDDPNEFYSKTKWLPSWVYEIIGENSMFDAAIGRRPVSWTAFILACVSWVAAIVGLTLLFIIKAALALYLFLTAMFCVMVFGGLHIYTVIGGPISLKKPQKGLIIVVAIFVTVGISGFMAVTGRLDFSFLPRSFHIIATTFTMLCLLVYLLLRRRKK